MQCKKASIRKSPCWMLKKNIHPKPLHRQSHRDLAMCISIDCHCPWHGLWWWLWQQLLLLATSSPAIYAVPAWSMCCMLAVCWLQDICAASSKCLSGGLQWISLNMWLCQDAIWITWYWLGLATCHHTQSMLDQNNYACSSRQHYVRFDMTRHWRKPWDWKNWYVSLPRDGVIYGHKALFGLAEAIKRRPILAAVFHDVSHGCNCPKQNEHRSCKDQRIDSPALQPCHSYVSDLRMCVFVSTASAVRFIFIDNLLMLMNAITKYTSADPIGKTISHLTHPCPERRTWAVFRKKTQGMMMAWAYYG